MKMIVMIAALLTSAVVVTPTVSQGPERPVALSA